MYEGLVLFAAVPLTLAPYIRFGFLYHGWFLGLLWVSMPRYCVTLHVIIHSPGIIVSQLLTMRR
jgi:hypothetical protein